MSIARGESADLFAAEPDNRLAEPLQNHVDRLPAAWRERLAEALASPSFDALRRFVDLRREAGP